MSYNNLSNRNSELSTQEVKDVLGTLGEKFTDDQIKTIATEVQFLADTWLDEFETKMFDGKTIQELLSEEILE